jgi:amino acid permease
MANIYAACFLVQYNGPQFFFELKNPTRKRFYILSFSANTIVMVFCGSFAILGFARFGSDTPDNLLVAYDKAYAVWVSICVSLLTTYPFVFDAGRRSILSAFEPLTGPPNLSAKTSDNSRPSILPLISSQSSDLGSQSGPSVGTMIDVAPPRRARITQKQVWWLSTLVLIPIFTVIAIFVDSLGLVIGINGSLCGITIGFTIPGLIMFCRARSIRRTSATGGRFTTRRSLWIGGFLIGFGIFMTTLGMISLFVH